MAAANGAGGVGVGLPAPVSFAEEIRIQEESKALLEAGLRFPGLHGIGGVMPPAIASIVEINKLEISLTHNTH